MVVAAFHRRRVLPLMAQRQRLFEMTSGELIDDIRLSAVALSDEEVLCRVREMVEGQQRGSDLTLFPMCPSRGYISLGMRDVRASPPPIPKDAERRVANRAHAEAYKEEKDAEEARRKRKSLKRDELEKRRQQQRHDGLPVEPSSSPSSTDSSSDDDVSEVGRVLWTISLTRKRQVEALALVPRKALKEPVTQGEAIEVAIEQAGEEAPTPREAEALEPSEVEAPSIAEATEGEAEVPRTSEAEVVGAGAPRTTEAEVAKDGAPRTTEAEVAEAGAPGTTKAEAAEAGFGVAEPAAKDAEIEAGQASIPPSVQDPLPLQESTREVEDDPEGQPPFALKDVAEGRHWGSFEQFCQLVEWSLWTALSVVADDMPSVAQELEAWSLRKSMFLQQERDVWGQLRQQKDLLANANELLSAWSAEVEDLRLRCADMKAEAAMTREHATPLAARIKELEELTQVASERDTFRSRAEQVEASTKAVTR
ncbi:uncharacterized protein [Miscanthus floridulus]|uniref:uncharacterized protein n=1 Tax=Miscanthus floridulus TaxID=154761 RepID=UPI0034589CD1